MTTTYYCDSRKGIHQFSVKRKTCVCGAKINPSYRLPKIASLALPATARRLIRQGKARAE